MEIAADDEFASTLPTMASSVPVNTRGAAHRRAGNASAQHPLEALLDALPAFALLTRENGIVVFCNAPIAHACGWDRDVQTVRHLESVLPPEGTAPLLAPQGGANIAAALRGPDGTLLAAIWSSRRFATADGEVFLLVTGRDASREQALERHLIEQQWFETAAALSGGLAHDFNNVLAAILGLSEIIGLRLPPDSPLQDFTRKLGESVDRAKLLVRRFSQFSRKSPHVVEAQPTALVLDELARVLVAFLPGSVSLETALSPETPWCLADRHALEHILLNCANYLRAQLREATGRLVLVSHASAGATSRVAIELRASGQGLLGLDVEAAFALSLAPTDSAYQSGAGLFTARVLATRLGGSLQVRRTDPRTVAFVLELPVAE